jgi:Tfp pilus assembly pilus retraction ATPase PilT
VGRPDQGRPLERASEEAPVTGMSGWLEALVNARGSDLHVKVGSSPRMRVDGRLVVLDGPQITSELAEALLSDTRTSPSRCARTPT